MQDTLERERLIDNLIDRVFRLEEEVARLKEQLLLQSTGDVLVPEPETGGWWRLVVVDRGKPRGPQLEAWEVM